MGRLETIGTVIGKMTGSNAKQKPSTEEGGWWLLIHDCPGGKPCAEVLHGSMEWIDNRVMLYRSMGRIPREVMKFTPFALSFPCPRRTSPLPVEFLIGNFNNRPLLSRWWLWRVHPIDDRRQPGHGSVRVTSDQCWRMAARGSTDEITVVVAGLNARSKREGTGVRYFAYADPQKGKPETDFWSPFRTTLDLVKFEHMFNDWKEDMFKITGKAREYESKPRVEPEREGKKADTRTTNPRGW